MINKVLHSMPGFTIMETLVAVLMLSIAIAGPLTIASKGLLVTQVAKDQDTAYFLAQDAVEYIRFVRDSNRLQGLSWLAGLENCTSSDGSLACRINSAQGTVSSCQQVGACTYIGDKLLYDSTTHTYNYTSGTATNFYRNVSIVSPYNGVVNEAYVVVTVSWISQARRAIGTTPTSVHTVVVREELYNWQ